MIFVAVLFYVVITNDVRAGEPKHTVKEVMKQAHKDGLLKKVIGGDATDGEKQNLLDLYISLLDYEPEKGDADSWNSLAENVVISAAKVVVGRDGAADALKKATNCGVCHKAHKPG